MAVQMPEVDGFQSGAAAGAMPWEPPADHGSHRHVMAHSIPVPHPFETIRKGVLEPLGMSVNRLAKVLGITATRLDHFVRGRHGTKGSIDRSTLDLSLDPVFSGRDSAVHL